MKIEYDIKIGNRLMTTKNGRAWSGQFGIMLYDFEKFVSIDLNYIEAETLILLVF